MEADQETQHQQPHHIASMTSATLCAELTPGELTLKTMRRMRATYAKRKLELTEAQWDAIEDAVKTMEAMASASAKPLVYLSSLDPGVGKTQAAVHFIPMLLASEAHKDVGAIICLARLKEIGPCIREMGFDDDDDLFSVYVYGSPENEKYNRLGNQDKAAARVMITTQQMVESKGKLRGSFGRASEFYYRGRLRAVRIWDESMLPARPLLINVTLIEGMKHSASERTELFDAIKRLIVEIDSKKSGDLIDIPDFDEVADINAYEAAELFARDKEEVRSAANDLWLLSGKTVRVAHDMRGNTILDYADSLLDDLKPILVLDASGRVRQTYKQWKIGRGDLSNLRSGEKNYGNLKPHVWRRTGSKHAWLRDHDELACAVAKEIAREPEKRCLVLYPKKKITKKHTAKTMIQRELEALGFHGEVDWLHWGDHAASNDYRECNKVILATVLFRDKSYYEAVARASLGLKSDEKLTPEQLAETKKGEHRDVILQSVCRGSVRKPLGKGGCYPCDLYIIASPENGIEKMLGSIFPGCQPVAEWYPKPDGKRLTNKQSQVLKYVHKWTASHFPKDLKFSQVRDHYGIDASNFRDIWQNARFQAELDSLGIKIKERKGKHGNVFYRPTPHMVDGLPYIDSPF